MPNSLELNLTFTKSILSRRQQKTIFFIIKFHQNLRQIGTCSLEMLPFFYCSVYFSGKYDPTLTLVSPLVVNVW